jgi:exodeoxyribonuclease V alpha subunit
VKFEQLVEVTNVYPGPIGGCVFMGVYPGIKQSISFRVNHSLIARNPDRGEFWHVKGDSPRTEKYGTVVVVRDAMISALPDDSYIVKFLAVHPRFRHFRFGKRGAEKLVEDIGAPELVKLLNNGAWKTIADARITDYQSQRLCDEWLELKDETELATFLSEHNLGSDLAKTIVRLCKYNTVERLKKNPFSLVALSNSKQKTLKLIAAVANKLDITSDDDKALIGCVEFTLYQALQKGHTIMLLADVIDTLAIHLLTIGCSKTAEEAICIALKSKSVCVLEQNGQTYLQAISLGYIEQYVENRLTDLHRTYIPENLFLSRSELPARIEQYNQVHARNYGWALVDKQCEAVEMALTHRVSLLSGYGGTGKTAVLKAIVDLSQEMGVKVHVAALAGKAANRVSQAIGRPASTIHNMLNKLKKKSKFRIDIKADPLLVIDEVSMVDISLICSLLKEFEEQPLRILLVGDTAQLPPIGFGLFWHKLVESNASHVKLTQVHRHIEGSALHDCAMKIRNGIPHDLPIYTGETEGVYLMADVIDYTSAIVQLRNTFDCMVLTSYASSRFKSSTSTLNPLVQSVLNPIEVDENVMHYGLTTLQADDPVLATKNAHDKGIFNGMTGTVLSIEYLNGNACCHVKFDDIEKVRVLTREDCWEIGLQLAYLITIHKSQGSEYNECVILMDSPYLERSGLYTALTRTKKLCILVGTNEQYNNAIMRPPSYKGIRSGFAPRFKTVTELSTLM